MILHISQDKCSISWDALPNPSKNYDDWWIFVAVDDVGNIRRQANQSQVAN
jgi:hypothetical protein